jgi:hypothetical protein
MPLINLVYVFGKLISICILIPDLSLAKILFSCSFVQMFIVLIVLAFHSDPYFNTSVFPYVMEDVGIKAYISYSYLCIEIKSLFLFVMYFICLKIRIFQY